MSLAWRGVLSSFFTTRHQLAVPPIRFASDEFDAFFLAMWISPVSLEKGRKLPEVLHSL